MIIMQSAPVSFKEDQRMLWDSMSAIFAELAGNSKSAAKEFLNGVKESLAKNEAILRYGNADDIRAIISNPSAESDAMTDEDIRSVIEQNCRVLREWVNAYRYFGK